MKNTEICREGGFMSIPRTNTNSVAKYGLKPIRVRAISLEDSIQTAFPCNEGHAVVLCGDGRRQLKGIAVKCCTSC